MNLVGRELVGLHVGDRQRTGGFGGGMRSPNLALSGSDSRKPEARTDNWLGDVRTKGTPAWPELDLPLSCHEGLTFALRPFFKDDNTVIDTD